MEDSDLHICPNPECMNNDPSVFSREGSGVVCTRCRTFMYAHEYDEALAKHSGSQNRSKSLSHSMSEPASLTDTDSSGPRSLVETFSCAEISSLLSHRTCTRCTAPLATVEGGVHDKTPLAYHCRHCGDYKGVDDSSTDEDIRQLLDEVFESARQGTLLTYPCPGGCGNDKCDNFTTKLNSEGGLLVCGVCGYESVMESAAASGYVEDAVKPSGEEYIPKCRCTNDNPELFGVQQDDAGARIQCHVCDVSVTMDIAEDVLIDMSPPRGRTEIGHLDQLKPGDHISWHQSLSYWHHAIVVKVSAFVDNQLKVIHYTGPDKQYGGKGVITEEWLFVDCTKEALYRQDYDISHPAEKVIELARSRLGEKKYNLLMSNCEHFAQWCRTGVHRSGQVESFTEYIKRIGKKMAAFASKDTTKQGIHFVKKVASTKEWSIPLGTKSLGTVTLSLSGPQNALSKSGATMARCSAKDVACSIGKLDYVATGLVVVLEVGRAAYDVHGAWKQHKRGDISRPEFQRVAIKRVTQGVGGAAGTIGGGIAGQMLIPIPIVGSLVGCTLGALIGEGLGSLLGRQFIKLKDGK